MNRATRRSLGLVLAGAPLLLAMGACDGLGLGGEPETLRVEVDAASGADLVLVTSPRFLYQDDPACEPADGQSCPQVLRLLAADTATINAPVKNNYPFTQTLQYYVEVFPATTATTVTLRVYVDGRPWSNETRELSIPADPAGDRESLQFVYQYSQPRIN